MVRFVILGAWDEVFSLLDRRLAVALLAVVGGGSLTRPSRRLPSGDSGEILAAGH
jgi:hypothetical protein